MSAGMTTMAMLLMIRLNSGVADCGVRAERDQGPETTKYTGLPSKAAASTLIMWSGCSGTRPSQALRSSAKTTGTIAGFTGVNVSIGSWAAEKSVAQSGSFFALPCSSGCGTA